MITVESASGNKVTIALKYVSSVIYNGEGFFSVYMLGDSEGHTIKDSYYKELMTALESGLPKRTLDFRGDVSVAKLS